MRTAWADTQHYAAYVLAENEGHAADAFNTHVKRLVDDHTGSLTLTLQGCERIERACWDQAQAIRDLKHQFEELAAEFALTFVIGEIIAAILAVPTAGGSEAAGQAAEAAEAGGITARAMALLRQFIAAVVTRMKTISTALKDLARVLPKAVRESAGLPGDGRIAVDPKIRQEAYDYATREAKLTHVIDPEKHKLGWLVEAEGGREQAMKRIIDSLVSDGDLPEIGPFEVSRIIDGQEVTIRGAVVNGVPKIGTAFAPY